MRTMTGTRTTMTKLVGGNSAPIPEYSIPGDTGKPWRQEKLIEFASRYPASFDPVALGFLNEQKATKEERTWWAFLYSTCYSIPTACALYKLLPLSKVERMDLEQFWVKNKKKLVFQSDRKYVGSMNKLPLMILDFLGRTKGRPWEYMENVISSAEGCVYESLYREICTWFYFGRFGAVLFIDTFRKCLGLKFPIDSYDWVRGSTTTSGLFNAFYRDLDAIKFDRGEKLLTEEDKKWLDNKKDLVLKVLKKRYPDSHWDTISITRIFCTYRKLYKGTRYLGYYVDRQQEELITLEKSYPELFEIWSTLWELRKRGISKEYLGELNNRVGIRVPLEKEFLRTGEIV